MFFLKKLQNIIIAFLYFAYLKGANTLVSILSSDSGKIAISIVIFLTIIGSYIFFSR